MFRSQSRTTSRPARWLLLSAVLVAITAGGLAGADATDTAVDPGDFVADTASLVFSDGDHVVFEVGPHDGHDDDHDDDDLVDAKGTSGGDGPVVHDGFTTYGDAEVLPGYEILLVASDGIEFIRPRVEQAASGAMTAGAPSLTVPPGTIPAGTKLERGQIHVTVSSSSPCGGLWLGCGGPIIDEGVVQAGRIWINPRLLGRDPRQIDNTVRHELGHTLGLGHYSSAYEDRLQTMHATKFDASAYESGDRAGFFFVTGKPAPAPAPPAASAQQPSADPAPPPEPRAVDPVGTIESVGSTPFGLVISGWAFDPDNPAPVSVLVTVDGAPLEVLASRVRSTGTADGFVAAYSASPGTHDVCAMARNLGAGVDTFLGCRTVDVSAQSIGSVGLQTL